LQGRWPNGYVPEATAQQMLLHPKVSQCVNNLIDAILGDGGRWIPAINPYGPDKSYFEEARKYADFLTFASRLVRSSQYGVVRQMLSYVHKGNKVASPSTSDIEVGRY